MSNARKTARMSAPFEIPEWLIDQSDPSSPPPVDDHRVEGLVNGFIAGKQDALFAAPDAYYRTQGRDALDGAPAIAQRLQDLRSATLDRARDDGERAALEPRLDAHLDDAMDGIGRHVEAQREVFQRNTLGTRQALIQRAAALEHDNDDKIAGLAEAHAGAAQELARLDGVDPDSSEAAAIGAAARSQILRTAIDQRIANARPQQAIDFYDKAKALLTSDDRRALELPIGAASDDAATDAWLARESIKDGAPLVERAGLDYGLSDMQRLILRAKIDARDSAAESSRAATVKGLDDQLAAATKAIATQPSQYRTGTLNALAKAYEDAGASEQAADTRRLASQESLLRLFAQTGVAIQQRALAEMSGPERTMAEAIMDHQADAFAKDPYAAGTATYPDVGLALPEEDTEGRLRQARMIEAMRGTPTSSDAETTNVKPDASPEPDSNLPDDTPERTDGPLPLQGTDPNLVLAADGPQAAPSSANDEPQDNVELAQAKQPPAKVPLRKTPPPQKTSPQGQPKPSQPPAAQKPPSPEEITLEADRRAVKRVDYIYGQPDTSTQKLLPDDWQQTTNPQYVEWMRDAANKSGVPLELLARHLWKESTFNPKKQNGSYKGMGQLGPAAVAAVGIKGNFDYFDAKSSIYASAAYLGLMHRLTKSWPAAVAAYNAGPGNIKAWLDNQATRYEPNKETREAIRHVFRGNPEAFGN